MFLHLYQKNGEFTALSSVLPDILSHVVLGETKIASVCNFYPSNTLLASAINRNSIIMTSFNFSNEDNDLDSNSLYEFFEIKGIESPQIVEKVDDDSFLVVNSKSSIYILNTKNYFSDQMKNQSNSYEKVIDSPQQSEPKCLSFFDGFVAVSTSTGLLICKIIPSKSMTKINESDLNIEFFPCSLFYEEYANAHNLTFIKINDTSVLLFFITSMTIRIY